MRYIFCNVIIQQNFTLVAFSTGRRRPPYRMEGGKSMDNSIIANFLHPLYLAPRQFIKIFMTASVMRVLW